MTLNVVAELMATDATVPPVTASTTSDVPTLLQR